MSRLEQSGKNIIFSFVGNILSALLGLVSRTVFIAVLGADYLGLAGLLGNVLGFLAISELGIATAIGFSLYKPLAERDYKSVSALMSLYRRAYRVIGLIVFVAGIGLFFSLDFFVPPAEQPAGTDFAYFTFLATTVFGYFLSYKTTLINSDNRAYRIMPLGIVMNVVQTFAQIAVLLIWRSYIIYLIVQLACSLLLMVLQNRFITREYKEVDFRTKEKISDEQRSTIRKNVGGLIIQKIGDYLVNSTDNLIITKFVSLAATGIYSNYLMIRNLVNAYIGTFFTGTSAAMGNVVAVETDERKRELFDTMMFGAFFIYSFEAVCFMCLFNPFIGEVWIGEKFVFDTFTVAMIVVNNYLTGLRIPLITMKGASGTYLEDSWVPFAFAGINLAASIILAKVLGVAGVFLGTIIGSLCTADWYRPVLIYRKVFHAPVRLYFKRYVLYVFLGLGYTALGWKICSYIELPVPILSLLAKGVVAAALPVGLNVLLFRRTKEFEAVRVMAGRIRNGIRKKLARRKAQ